MKLTKAFVENALRNTLWDVGNQALYDLCRREPLHKRDGVIVAKIWLIGRAYSAAVERRKAVTTRGDSFYADVVAPAMRKAPIDRWIGRVSSDPVDPHIALEAHRNLTDLLENISELRKTSLASKYLHFHVPSAFFIFDSRARTAIRALPESVGGVHTPPLSKDSYDRDYASFYFRCLTLTARIKGMTRRRMSPRELDKVLLATFEAIRPRERTVPKTSSRRVQNL